MDEQAHRYQLQVSGLEGIKLNMPQPVIHVPAGEVLNLPVSVRIDPVVLKRAANKIEFSLTELDNPELARIETARFLGPVLSR
jgi:hypothetical protein